MFTKAKTFLQESFQELHRVNWPSRQNTIKLTAIVIFLSVLVALFLGILDMIFSYALRLMI